MNRPILCVSLSLTVLAAPVAAQDSDFAARLNDLAERIEAQRIELHIPGLALAVVKDDEVVLARGFGLASLESETPVSAETLFAIGSSSKAFTATLVGMLVDEGKAGWDDPVTKYLPYFELGLKDAEPGAEVTLRDLLSHRTGFLRMDLLWANGKATSEEILRTAAGAEPRAPFRKEFHYNNIMFLAAGTSAGLAAGKDWSTLVRERIFLPLGMRDTNTSVSLSQKDPRLALGYEWDLDESRFEHKPMRTIDSCAPAGAINSNALDMAQWLRFQLGRGEYEGTRLISEASLRETWTKQNAMGAGAGYGLGWFLHEWNGQPVIEHGGNIDGFGAQVAFLPESNLGYVLLTNVTMTPLQGGSMQIVWGTLLDPKPDASAADALALEHAACTGTYIGNFASFSDAKFQVLEQNGRLAVDVPGQIVYELKEPDADGKWFFTLTDTIAVSFDRDPEGTVVGMKMYQSGLVFELPREGVVIPVEIDLADAKRYLGRYHDPALDDEVTVVIQQNRLAVDVPDQLVFELHKPDAEGKRALRMNSALAVRFEEDPSGAVSGLTFFEGGAERLCPRVPEEGVGPLPTLDEVMALRKIDQISAALAATGALRMSGTVKMPESGVSGTTTALLAGTDRWHNEVDFAPFGYVHMTLNGERAVVDSSFGPREELLGKKLAAARLEHPAAIFGDWRIFYDSVQVRRRDELDGQPVLVLILKKADLPDKTLWIDAASGDPRRLDSFEFITPTITMPSSVRFEDYREVQGLRLPFRIVNDDELTGLVTAQYESIEANVALEPQAFEVAEPPSADGH